MKSRETKYSSTDEDTDFELQESGDSPLEEEDVECVGCGEPYKTTVKKDDWIQCVYCKSWCHETCSNC